MLSAATAAAVEFTLEVAQDSIQRKVLDYDATGDAHYDVASAFIKSMRGSDPDAAIYWLARMLEAGEDPRFIARRDRHLRVGGRGQRRSAGAGRGGGGPAGRRVRRPAGVPARPGPGRHLHCHGAEVERLHAGDRQGPRGRAQAAGRCRCRSTCAMPITGGPSSSATARATSTATISKAAGSSRQYLAGGAPLLRAGGPRLRGGDSPQDEPAPSAAR